jgi:2-polyprenyl-3-methyl-5-hydroxy-6-metoxy-1,4-benzoquinol methylase
MLGLLKNVLQRKAAPLEQQPQLAPSMWCGLRDATLDGWFQVDKGVLLEGFAISAEDQVLDVGCGDGVATLFAANQGASVIFTDTEADKIEALGARVAQTQARAWKGLVSDSVPLPLEDACATRVICLEVLEHVDDPRQVMAELVRAGKPGAQYLISVPAPVGEELQRGIAPASYFQSPNHVRTFSHEAIAELITDAGLVIEHRQATGFFWVMNMIFYWAGEKAAGRASEGAVRDHVAVQHNPLMDDWAGLWGRLLNRPEGRAIKEQLDRFMPKSQVLIARKPGQPQA